MDPFEIQESFYYQVYNTDDYKVDRRKPYGHVLKELELLPYPKEYLRCKLLRQVNMQSLQQIAARAVIRECKHPLKRELLLEQIPHPIRIFINQVHVGMLDYWIESESNFERIYKKVPGYYKYVTFLHELHLIKSTWDNHELETDTVL